MIYTRSASGLKATASLKLRDSGAVLRTIGTVRIRDAGNVLRTVWTAGGGGGGFTASAVPLSSYGGIAQGSTTTVYADAITVTPTGGAGPYTYAWALVSGDPGTWTFTAPAAQTSRVGRANVAPGTDYTHIVKCTVTDASGATADTPDITVTVENFGELSGLLP